MNRIIFHIDLNCFYASVEMLLHPEYRGVPMAVVGDKEARKGIILAKNPLAKKYNIQTGELIHEALLKCPKLICVQADFFTYLDYSKRVRKIYRAYTDQVESFGIDEAWLDLSQMNEEPQKLANQIKDRIRQELGLTVSIGISFNKIFAKLASDLAGMDEIVTITPQNTPYRVWPLPVQSLLYVGRATQKKLKLFDIVTIGDLAQQPLPFLRRHFGKWGEILYTFSRGLDTSPVQCLEHAVPIKSIGNSMTCPKDCTSMEQIHIILSILCESVASRLKTAGFLARTVTIYVRDNQLISFTRQAPLPTASDLFEEIAAQAWQLAQKHISMDYPIRSLGVSVSNLLHHDKTKQLSLFEAKPETEALEQAMESIRRRFGHRSITHAITRLDQDFSQLNPREEHLIFPENYFR